MSDTTMNEAVSAQGERWPGDLGGLSGDIDAILTMPIDCFECCGREYVIVTLRVAGGALRWDDCPRCGGTGEESSA